MARLGARREVEEKGSIIFEGSKGVLPPCLKTVMVISIGCLPGQNTGIGKRPEIKPAMDWVLAFPIMGIVWLPKAAGRCCLHAPPSSQLSLIHIQVSFIISWGLRCGEVSLWQWAWVQKQKKRILGKEWPRAPDRVGGLG